MVVAANTDIRVPRELCRRHTALFCASVFEYAAENVTALNEENRFMLLSKGGSCGSWNAASLWLAMVSYFGREMPPNSTNQ